MIQEVVGIIGTAGRKDDAPRLGKRIFAAMCRDALEQIQVRLANVAEDYELVSGGAAWADHIAVRMFNAGFANKLTLCLPCLWMGGQEFDPLSEAGSTANYYHENFSIACGIDSFREIQKAIDNGATVEIYRGFKERNTVVAKKATRLIAYTFGTHSSITTSPAITSKEAGLKDGGTTDTWNKSKAKTKIHVTVQSLERALIHG